MSENNKESKTIYPDPVTGKFYIPAEPLARAVNKWLVPALLREESKKNDESKRR